MASDDETPGVDDVDELYGLAPEKFVTARDALAKRLKAEGDTEGARAVKTLRRPTVAAWAVNRLRREHGQALDELLELGERLRRAQAKIMTGGGAGTLKELLAERRATVDRVARLAAGELGTGGAAPRDAVVATLEAALADPDDATAVRAGRLSKELPAPSGFGVGDWSAGVIEDDVHDDEVDTERAGKADQPQDGEQQRRRRAQRQLDERRGALRQATDEVDAAQRERDAAHDEVERLETALAAAKERAQKAAERLRLAERRAGATVEALEEAERALRDVSVEYRR